MSNIDARTESLVNLIKLIALAADENNKQYWVGSGFAIDLSLGKLTRSHEDIDLGIDYQDVDWWKVWFESQGYRVGKYDYMHYFPHAFAVYGETEKFLVEVWPMELREDGTLRPYHTENHPGREWWKGQRWDNIREIEFENTNVIISDPQSVINQKLEHVRYHRERLLYKHEHDVELMGRTQEYRELLKELGL